MTLVVDASALVVALTSSAAHQLRDRLARERVHAPHLLDAEVGHVLRRQVLRRELSAADGAVLLSAGAHLVDHRHPGSGPLAARAWELREAVSFYDALYVGVAEGLGCPLLTADRRLARASGLRCDVEVVALPAR